MLDNKIDGFLKTIRRGFAYLHILTLLFGTTNAQTNYLTERPDWAGVWVNSKTNNTWPKVSNYALAGITGRMSWAKMQPSPGHCDFSDLRNLLQYAYDNNGYCYFVVWTGRNAPDWIYDHGVPQANYSDEARFPYYLDEDYMNYAVSFFDSLAAGLNGFPQELIERIAFIQPGFGSTGDRQIYKGSILPEYEINSVGYVHYMKEMTKSWVTAFNKYPKISQIRFLWNLDNYDGSNPSELDGKNDRRKGEMLYAEWMRNNYNCQLHKQQFTIAVGYDAPNDGNEDQKENYFGISGRWGGNPEYLRGEFTDAKNNYLSKLNRALNYYWIGIASVHKGLDGWEINYNDFDNPDELDIIPALEFSGRYSFNKRATTSPYAFIALRDILDYSDSQRFPESVYGEATKNNQARVEHILAEYASYGARNDDMDAVLKKEYIAYVEEVTGYNDCLWNVITPNLQRFISQIDPNETSAGYYRVGLTETPTSWIGEPYGRYARGFDVANGKNTMYFDVDDQYFASNRNKGNGKLKVKIIYYANDGGSWELKYHAADGTIKTACSVSNEVGKNWRTKEVTIEDALLDNGGPKGADLILQNTGGTNCRFHMIELERDLISLENTNQYPYQGMQRNIPGFIEGEFYDEGGEGFAYHADTLKEGTGNFRPEDNVDILARDSASNGYCVGFTGNGEWLEYTLDVTSGLYNISLHYFCSEPVGELILSLDGTVLTTISGLSSNGGETPLTFEVEKVPITGGQKKTLKLEFSGGSGFELDGIEFSLIKIPVSGISISQCPSGKLNVSHSHQMYANVYPVEASNKTVRWSTSDASVATVDSMGLLRAVSTGFVTISASTTEADYSATCEINVGPLLVTEVIIEKCPNMLYEGSTEQLTAIIKPAGVDNASLTWNSSDNNVLAVNESGLIRAIKEGSATVSLTTTDGKFISSCEIVVRKPEITLSGISITNCPAEKLKIDETLQLNVKFLPEGIEDQPLSWRATDTTIVKVDESGLVSTLSDGTSLVIATCKGYTRYCVVHVASALTNAPDKVVQLNKDVKVYPNPANKNCYIDFSNIDNEKCVNIYNENGQLLYTETTFDKALELNLDNFANQTLLFVQVILSKNTVVNKIVRILR